MPDLNHSIAVHRQNLQSIWRSGIWHEAKLKFLEQHPDGMCERCGLVGAIVPGHTSADYLDMPSYIPKVAENRVEALCPKCNRKEAKGLKPCPVCVKESVTDIWYIPQDKEYCPNHRPEEEKRQSAEKKKSFKAFVRKVQDKKNAEKRKFYRMVKGK